MKAITCRTYGVLQLEEVDEPVPGADDVLVDVHAASVNAADWHLIRGGPFIARLKFGLRRPSFGIPGCDLAGTVRAVGRNVTPFQVGDAEFGTSFLQVDTAPRRPGQRLARCRGLSRVDDPRRQTGGVPPIHRHVATRCCDHQADRVAERRSRRGLISWQEVDRVTWSCVACRPDHDLVACG